MKKIFTLALSAVAVGCSISSSDVEEAVERTREFVGRAHTASSAPTVGVADSGASSTIRVNQVGFHPTAPKVAIVSSPAGERAAVVDAAGVTVFEGPLTEASVWSPSEELVQRFDFSAVRSPGRYRIVVDGNRESAEFAVAADILLPVTAAALKAFYFNRASAEIARAYGSRWSRAAGHPDTRVLVHASAASAGRPAGTVISSPGGWYDAGDYNKYVVNSAFATYALLAAFEDNRRLLDALRADIPESGNATPDILDEARWNLEWMLTMQDPDDGGVYHKLTSQQFSAFVPPASDTSARYVVQKSTAAALDFAAVTAVAARTFDEFDPPFATRLRHAAIAAWDWSADHPDVLYTQPSDIGTGEYGSSLEGLTDERIWAATELSLTTGDGSYLEDIALRGSTFRVPSWSNVGSLAWLSILRDDDVPADLRAAGQRGLVRIADRLVAAAAGGYGVSLLARDFRWGSNGTIALHAVILAYASALTGDPKYAAAAAADIDYLLGRNPLGMSFLTGFGARTPQRIHHRPSAADGIDAPVPGLLVGGPNTGREDPADCNRKMPTTVPALSYLDDSCSFATNEVAINWQGSFVWAAVLTQREIEAHYAARAPDSTRR